MQSVSPLLIGNELIRALETRPEYDENIRLASPAERLMALNHIYDIYCPSSMTCEIYSKLYFAYARALQKKETHSAIKQSYLNHCHTRQQGIMGGSDSFTIVGASGIGKSTAIGRAISIITKEQMVEHNGTKIIPYLLVQTPCDASLKGLLLEMLRLVDAILETKYYVDARRSGSTTDILIGLVSQVCLNHICVLVIDEAQNLLCKNGRNLVNALVQLINNSGISLCFVGTMECVTFFESAFQLARRSIGLSYSALKYDEHFRDLCETLFLYQYTTHKTILTEDLAEWLYLHSGGVVAVVVGLVYSAQEIAILEGLEQLNISVLDSAYKRRFGMLHKHLYLDEHSGVKTRKVAEEYVDVPVTPVANQESSFADSVALAKASGEDIFDYLKRIFVIEEIAL